MTLREQLNIGILATLAAAVCSCSEEEPFTPQAESLSEEQVEKIAYGCDSYTSGIESDEKIETIATEEYMEMLRERLENERNTSGNKSVALEQMVGVVKNKTCGKYDEVRIYYDSEDKHTNYRASRGYRGDWISSHNLTMYFCLVPARLFHNTKDNYGVMNFSNDNHFYDDRNYDKVGLINGYMDAEDSKCGSAIYYTKRGQREQRDTYSRFTGNTKLVGNGNLQYQMFVFTTQPSNYGYPDLGFDYGVFGMFNLVKDFDDRQGKVHSDDEDSHNANSATLTYQKTKDRNIAGSCHLGIIEVSDNTDFFIAKITSNK